MHGAAFKFVEKALANPPLKGCCTNVIEIGSRNINGSVRQLFTDAESYLATDICGGQGVDKIVDATDPTALPAGSCNTVVCCEVLEHAPVTTIVLSAANWLCPGGFFIATMATTGRSPHSAVDGGSPRADEHYENVTADAMLSALEAAGLELLVIDINQSAADLYVLAMKPKAD